MSEYEALEKTILTVIDARDRIEQLEAENARLRVEIATMKGNFEYLARKCEQALSGGGA